MTTSALLAAGIARNERPAPKAKPKKRDTEEWESTVWEFFADYLYVNNS